jgi:hypothetical protein
MEPPKTTTRIIVSITGDLVANTPTTTSEEGENKSKKPDFYMTDGQFISEIINNAMHPIQSKIGKLAAPYRYGANQLVSQISNAASYATNRYLTLHEEYMGQQQLSNIKTTINKAQSLGSSVATGAAVGGWVGAIGGAVSWGISQHFEYQQRMSSYYQQLNATNFQTEFSASKLGLNGSSGTEN